MTVAEGVTLTVEPGAVVQVDNNYGIYVNGTLSANGATFTRNGNAYWLGIYLAPTADLSNLTNCNISYGGASNSGYGLTYIHGDYRKTSIYVDSSSPTISGCQISNSETNGVELYSSHATITSNSFGDMGGGYYPIFHDTLDTFTTMSGNSTSGSGYNGVGVVSGSFTVSGNWNLPGSNFPYLMNGPLTVTRGVTLTIAAGNTVKSNWDGFYVNGTLSAVGTSTAPITFSSRSAIPAAGNWRGIYLSPTAGASVLSYVTVEYAGAYNSGYGLAYVHSNYQFTSLYLDSVSPSLTNVTIRNSETNGLELYGSSSVIGNGVFSACGRSGLRASAGSWPVINTASITNNGSGGYFAVSLDASSVPDPTNVSFSGNTKQGVEIRGGTLGSSATWKNWSSNAPYAVTGNVTTDAGTVLTIEPTTTVKLWRDGLYMYGKLIANSATGRITFTSLTDDSVGGDTNGDGTGSSPVAGDWLGIYLAPTADLSNLTNCDIGYGGAHNSGYGLDIYPHGLYPMASIYIDSGSPTISGCQMSNSETHGIELYSSHATITSSSFSNMGSGYYPIRYDSLDTFTTMSGNSTSGSGYNGVGVVSGSFTVSGNWNLPGSNFPYLMNGPLTVNEGVTLTIAAGNTVRSNWDGFYVNGTLSAVGTSTAPITFSSRSAIPAAGNWRGIYLSPTAGASVLSYVTVEYAGAYNSGYGLAYVHGNYQFTSLYLDSVSPSLTNVTIRNSETNGLELYGSSSVIGNGVFSACGWSGLRASAGSRPVINTASITNNGSGGYFAVSLDATSVPDPTNVSFSGNTKQGVEIRGGTLGSSATWKNWSSNAPYAVTGNVATDAGTILTIEPTTTVKLWRDGLYMYGKLIANSATGRITFTSLTDDSVGGDTNGDGTGSSPVAGDWLGIYLAPTADLSNLTNCNISYGGASNSGYGLTYIHGDYRKTSIYVDSSSPTISGCQISNSETNGVELYSSHATITSNSFGDMGGGYYPIFHDTLDTFTTMSGNSTSGSGYNGVGVVSGSFTVSGNWNLPGSNFPYLMNGPLTVDSGVTLTIAAGNTVKSNGSGFYVNGTLSAIGTSTAPITFSSRNAVPAAGNWLGIYLSPTAGASVLSYVTVEYAGAYNSGYGLVYVHGNYQFTSLYLDSISPSLTNVIIRNSETNGLELYGSSSAITNSLFSNCGWTQVAAKASSNPIIGKSRFIGGSSVWGLTNDTPSQIINARNNYWGAASGPTISSNPGGAGVKISDGVDYGDFRTSENFILTVNITGTGSVYSSPGGISCNSGSCTASYGYLQSVALSASPAWYTYVVWSGCTAAGNNCSLIMDTDRSVTANFIGNNNVRLDGPTPTLYSRIMDAYSYIGVSGSGVIQAQTFTFLENLLFNNPVNVVLEGGKNASFVQTSNFSKVDKINITKGKVTIRNIAIK